MEGDCHITFGYHPKIVIAIVQDIETKFLHDMNADDVSNSCVKPGADIFAKSVLSNLHLEVGNARTGIAKTIQVRVALAHIRQEALVGHLYEGGTTV